MNNQDKERDQILKAVMDLASIRAKAENKSMKEILAEMKTEMEKRATQRKQPSQK
jgi:hypothetical protein